MKRVITSSTNSNKFSVENAHTFNNCGDFDIVCDDGTYHARWSGRGGENTLETDAPDNIYQSVYDWLFNDVE